jgi:tellurite resistance protein TerC
MHASIGNPGLWIGFIALVLVLLALDLGLLNRKDHVVGFREALWWTGGWAALALAFAVFVWARFGQQHAVEFLTGYLIEESLSIDNIFVFVVVLGALKIPAIYQHRVLYWGILTALVLRAAMIVAGTAVLQRFHSVMYLFGAFLIFTGTKLYLQRNQEEDPEHGWLMRKVRQLVPSTPNLHGHHFFVKENGRYLATPLLMALVLVELSDVVFAVDSIPAIFAVTLDPFIVFTSNIFAILGLRSMFFVLARMVDKFRYLKVGLSVVLVFVGIKMCIVDLYAIPAVVSLFAIIGILCTAIVASLRASSREASESSPDLDHSPLLPSRSAARSK